MTRRQLLALDAAINLGLGLPLWLLPGPTIAFLGLPAPATLFYVTLLGAVLTGIAAALWLERGGGGRGLGLAGALVINVLGAGTVLCWLVAGTLDIPLRGRVTLWLVALAVLGTGVAELAAMARRR